MRKALFFALIITALLCQGCEEETHDARFKALAHNYMEQTMAMHPEWATYLGDHRYDHMLNDYSEKGVLASRALNAAFLDSLKVIDLEKLSQTNQIDYRILRHQIKYNIFSADTLRSYEWNPMNYNVGGAIYSLIARDFAPLEERMKNVIARLNQVPEVVDAAKINLLRPPQIYTVTAIDQVKGAVAMIRDQLPEFIAETPELQAAFTTAQDTALESLEIFVGWMENELLEESTSSFRIGDEKFRRKLYYALESDFTKEYILEKAMVDLSKTQTTMFEIARKLYPDYFPGEAIPENQKAVIKAVLDHLAETRPNRDNIVERAKKFVDECTDFVREKDLVFVPEEPLEVIVMPEFQRGFSVAYCDAPGPLEKNAKTFYAISPPPANWTDEQVASLYREYNDYMLYDLSIHEGTPGHYLQLSHANKFEAPTMIRALFGSGTFVEGWATYAEQFMAEAGFGGPEVKMQQLKMRLRLIINAIIDQKIHTEGMTREEAMDMMMNQGYQEEGEASGKWRRACLSSTQLSTYYVGNLEMNDIREKYTGKMNGNINLRTLHDTMLSFGSPAPKYVKEMMGL